MRFHGYTEKEALIALEPRDGESTLRTEDILDTIESAGPTIALVMLSGVQYYTGEFFDLDAITAAAHAQGCMVGFDLAHAVGNIDLHLHDTGMDFAVWCTYKYLNSGPGGIGGCFVHDRHAALDATQHSMQRFEGWWGHRKDDRFLMSPEFIGTPGAFGFQLSNPSVLCQAALRASVDIFERATMAKLRTKSRLLTGLLETLLTHHFDSASVKILTPRDPARRGCQLSLVFNAFSASDVDQVVIDVERVHRYITEQGVICDLRKPNVMRIAPCPLYNSFQDVYAFVHILRKALSSTDVVDKR